MGLGTRWVLIWAVMPMEAAEAPRLISANLLVSRPVTACLLGCGPMIGWYVIFFESCPLSRQILRLFWPLWLTVVCHDVVVSCDVSVDAVIKVVLGLTSYTTR